MPFPPHVQRVIYKKNPLIEGSFQVRFPRFLSIETEPPSEFQKLVIGQFPIYEQRQVFQISISVGGPERSDMPGKMHAFQSSDRNATIILASDSLAVSCSRYRSWEEFVPLVSQALDAFQLTYHLGMFTRVGLRYINVVARDDLGLSDRPWSDLLQPHIAGGFLGPSLSEADVLAKTTVLTVKLSDGDHVLLRHGLVTQNETKKIAYLIDSDFYNEEQRDAGLDAILEVAGRLHTNSGRLFRWCISDRLHVAMDPKPVPESK
jgi:uncharacterized protein (TIGR04255 family)